MKPIQEKTQKRMQILIVFLLAMVLCSLTLALASLSAAGYAGYQLAYGPDPEVEYHRALYDICVRQTGQPGRCLIAVGSMKAQGWYKKTSPGWRWPLPAAARQG